MHTQSQIQTEAIGLSLAAQLCPGDVLLLRGDLGAGKTVLARSIARGLGVTGPVTSPTFTLMQIHDEGRIPVHHFDLYRLQDADEFLAAGLEDFLHGNAVSLIEWPERASGILPACHLDIHIAYADEPEARTIAITPRGGFREVVL